MRISFDPAKRERILQERGLDFDDAAAVLSGPVITVRDDRRDYGEERWVSYGLLANRLVVVVWTRRGEVTHVISMRKGNGREKARYGIGLAGS